MKPLLMIHTLKNNTSLEVKEARKDDAIEIINYFKTVAKETTNLSFNADEFTITQEQEEELLETYYSSINQIYLLAKIEGKIVGIISLNSSSRKRLKHVGEFGVSVLKKDWNLGIGKILIQSMIEWAENNGVTEKITLRTNQSNIKAMALYQKFGFVQEGVLKKTFKVNGEYLDTIFMSKFLQ